MTESDNPILRPSALPHGLPDYANIRPEHYAPAFEIALAEHRAEVEAIASSTEPATFENTVVALERSGRALRRASAVFFTVTSADSTPLTDTLEAELAPVLSAHDDAITLDPRLFARLRSLYEQRDSIGLDPESSYLLERYHSRFVRSGALLDADGKSQLRALNEALSTLTTRFEKNLLADTNDLAVHVTDADELKGLDAPQLAATRAAAEARGLDGYLVTLTLYSGHPLLASVAKRATRERIMRASLARGRRGGDHDNRQTLLEIVRLRADRAALLGYASHADYVISDQTAGSPENVTTLLDRLAAPAGRNLALELERMQALADSRQDAAGEPRFTLESWDRAFYAEAVRAESFAVDSAALRPYFELERVLQNGVFAAAERLYGIGFAERADLPGYNDDVRVWEVLDVDGSSLGLFLGDFFTRDSKRGGAWMNSLVARSSLLGTSAVVTNNLNITRPETGSPALLTVDEVDTLFHEFGHALHGLFASTSYPRFAGTSVFRDFVEFPSQVNEMWATWPEILSEYAVHTDTGEPLDPAVIERMRAASTWGEGFATSEYLASAILDLAWHDLSAPVRVDDIDAFEESVLAAAGLHSALAPPRYASSYFAHVFSGGYSAGYYSYIWSEILDADTVEWFIEHGGPVRSNGDRFRRIVLGIGGSANPLEAYREFRGRDADIEPLLRRRGLQA
ncbi:M3 family metallopeptidase [Microbacteriaceae bacterium VKM Ac-2855]|nr:M3 family metallopeptidase [Microbacteriaceae bacterium VKM Ac-2855]